MSLQKHHEGLNMEVALPFISLSLTNVPAKASRRAEYGRLPSILLLYPLGNWPHRGMQLKEALQLQLDVQKESL
ncbi:hypothetical protein ABFS82_06G116400 [Erythranthe guttata]